MQYDVVVRAPDMNSDLRWVASAMILAGLLDAMPHVETTERHPCMRRHVCGSDNGKGRKRQSRNAPCVCGSGKKAKRCCVWQPQQVEEPADGE